MRALWRISNHIDLAGWGGRKFSSRWSSLGKRITYLAESPAGAMLEVLVHLKDRDDGLPATYSLMEVEAPVEFEVRDLMRIADAEWKDSKHVTQQIGDLWLDSHETVFARVPSAILPRTWNVLLNPEHPGAEQVRIVSVIHERFDDRLFRFGAG